MSSCEDLFQSPSIKLGLCNTSSDLFGDSSSKLIRVKEKQNEKQVGINNVVSLMPDFSSYEKHELVMESDTSHPAGSGLQCQLSSVDQENVIPSDCIPNLVMKTKPHQMASVSSAAFCSTPGPFNACFTPRLPKVHSETAPKTVSGDFLLNALQVTPIHPIFKNQNLSIKSEMETTVSQLNYQPKNTSLQPYHSIHGFVSTDNHNLIQDNLIPVDGINFSESLHQSSCNPYVCLSNERFENWQHYPESPIINKFIQAGKKSGSYTKRITRLFRYENMILNRSYMTLYGAGDVKGTLFKICGQSEYKTFAQLFVPFRRKNLRKIGEGCFGEVFRCLSEYNKSSNDKLDYVVIKLIPIEGDIKFNGESQKSFNEVLSEVIVSKELTALGMGYENNTNGFVELKKVHLIQGSFPTYLTKAWEKYDKEKGSENDNPRKFGRNQLWVALESAFCGVTLENNIPTCPCARISLLLQVGLSLAVAELELKFEHRDLHWGNVLISQSLLSTTSTLSSSSSSILDNSIENSCKYCSSLEKGDACKEEYNKFVKFRLNGKEFKVAKFGVTVYLIDFTMSRLEQDNGLVYVDLSCDPTLFQSKGDYQFDIYRFMRSENRNDWKTFTPKTNVMWFHYLTTKLCCNSDLSSVSPPSSTLTFHSTCWKILRDLEACTRSFSYDSAYHLVTSHKLFKDCSKFYTVS
ncbi:unnamed protein product [Heterobilharzia americana]|nr:unnamed protein product [Heterobilharzia americana]